MSVWLSWFLGAITTILVSLWVENLRRPRLRLRIVAPKDTEYQGLPANQVRFLLVGVRNENPSWLTRQRNAPFCRVAVTFHRREGTAAFGKVMIARWDASPEPVPMQGIIVGGPEIRILDPGRFEATPRMEIIPGEEPSSFAVAARFDADVYLVHVQVVGGGEAESDVFWLYNDCPRSSFRLEPAGHQEKALVSRRKSEVHG